jgi:hypothetical protein
MWKFCGEYPPARGQWRCYQFPTGKKRKSSLRNITQDLGLAGFFEHGDEPSGPIKSREFLK